MAGLAKAVERLVASATGGAKDEALRASVDAALDAFDAADTKDAAAALAVLETGIAKAEGRAAQVLHLALGALVEAGAPADAAWPAVARGLAKVLADATSFARACVEASGEQVVSDAIAAAGAAIAKKKPREAAAWQSLASRCLAAVACLTRSRALREKERASGALAEAIYALEDAVEEASFLSQALRIFDGPMLLLHPESMRGFRIEATGLSSNLELCLLATDALVAKHGLDGKRPDAKALAVLQEPERAPSKPPTTAIGFDLASASADPLWLDGAPADIPLFEGTRVVLVAEATRPERVLVEATFPSLRPSVEIVSEIPRAETKALFEKLVTKNKKKTTTAKPASPKKAAAKRPAKKTAKKKR